MLQELVILHGVLDALGKLIMEGSDEDEKLYLEGEMEKARSIGYRDLKCISDIVTFDACAKLENPSLHLWYQRNVTPSR